MIVAEGDPNFAGPNNSISFLGNFATNPVPAGVQFDAIRQEEGSSILAPAFSTTFAGNFSALSGVMAVSGVHFSGNVNALVEGTITAGFDTHSILTYNPASDEELPQ
jgi:hypothetical protein